ncbi:hypothetical protein [Qipengyuania gelatinilytica]|uniref:Uncharacterized protein n=1 Tax=Qipengyuania gelatinilytica TaxID=2867231 RepID=A0ABX9A7Y7_9SPHN|nr:hypothetical protein [Qipengyuania gelatinilytica]QZD96389.1 hypothetical protein K3136_06845 [Qipengyuania gelatinilytica]
MNLLLWKWSGEFDSPAKRKRHSLKFEDVTRQFCKDGDHPAIGDADISAFSDALDSEFGSNADNWPFALETYAKCAVVNYANSQRFELVPRIASIGRRFGLNASEF